MNKLTLLTGGCNSQIYAYGQGAEQVVLKVVSASNRKEQKTPQKLVLNLAESSPQKCG